MRLVFGTHLVISVRLMCLILGCLARHKRHRKSHAEQQNDIPKIFIFRIHFFRELTCKNTFFWDSLGYFF